MRSVCKFVCFCVNMGASQQMMKWLSSHWNAMVSLLFILMHSGKDQCGSGCLLSCSVSHVCVCVGPLCPGLFHMCLTLLWQGGPASPGRWRMSGTRAEKWTASQHLMEWETHSLHGWPADATAWEHSRGWRPRKTPKVCAKYHYFCLSLHVHRFTRIPKNKIQCTHECMHINHFFCASHNAVLHPLEIR